MHEGMALHCQEEKIFLCPVKLRVFGSRCDTNDHSDPTVSEQLVCLARASAMGCD